ENIILSTAQQNQKLVEMSVSDLMNHIESSIKRTFASPIWVFGEIEGLSFRKSGCFFNLAEPKQSAVESSTITVGAVIWSSMFKKLELKHGRDQFDSLLSDGLGVKALCEIGFYKDRGSVTLSVLDIDPNYTKGALALAREKLLRELRLKNLDRANKQNTLSNFPLKIGLVSAEDSRAKSDFLHQLFTYRFPGEVIFYPAQMQGEGILKEVARGIEALSGIGCDLIVLTRGGGSAADLRWFDSPQIAYAIALCRTPVVAAIGHHEDFCVAEEICFHREKTPTAAADYIIHVIQDTKDRISENALNMNRKVNDCLEDLFKTESVLRERLRGEVVVSISRYSDAILRISARIMSCSKDRVAQIQHTLSGCSSKMILASRSLLQNKRDFLGGCRSRVEKAAFFVLETKLRQPVISMTSELEKACLRKLSKFESVLSNKFSRVRECSTRRLDFFNKTLLKIEGDIAAFNPVPWIKKGWTQLFSKSGLIRDAGLVSAGEEVTAKIIGGRLHMIIEKIETGDNNI
ncbi:MAG: exodeoxyribonuclease VII large subunit, partial [Oligoflexales bacterium]|nr:exodeoxyribonuclease VII large subunit [Oligoflexales bacterium]